MRIILIFIAFFATTAQAQVRDSVFANYADYEAFVDESMKTRSITDLMLTVGGRDELTAQQMTGLEQQVRSIFPRDFEHVAVFRQEDLGDGVFQEGRMYWTGERYIFVHTILHQRVDDLVVLNFSFNSDVMQILSKF